MTRLAWLRSPIVDAFDKRGACIAGSGRHVPGSPRASMRILDHPATNPRCLLRFWS